MLINGTGFGWIEIDGKKYNTDIVIYTDGKVENRYKDFKGDNHLISKWEVEKIIKGEKSEALVIGTGQAGIVLVLDETKKFLVEQNIKLITEPTPQAIQTFNCTNSKKCALFHITC